MIVPRIEAGEAADVLMIPRSGIARADPTQGGSGAVHIAKVAERLGIADKVKAKSVITTRPEVTAESPGNAVANGRAEIALHQMQELVSVPGIDIVGPLPRELQETFFFSAVIVTGARRAEAGKALIDFLRTPDATAVIKAKGMEPAPL
ncbi:MAG: molybdate ABC transporter substrate-binding protein [Gemmatimonadaceae bacterium]